ncbi:MAG: proline--tRNA ligase [Candidatus Falkowbacteria bacterium]|nr:MAG: proline--tRNA ligase [Candidatus Falkowbacteria bacterium]
MAISEKRTITKQEVDFPAWYQDVVREAELAESSEVRGCGIVRPYGLKIWELIKAELSRRLEDDGVENVYFPVFVPLENLEAEKDHVEGFAPELAVVTHAGGEELTNKLAIRPTSEAAMYKTYAKWIQSYKDLPLRLNQWANVVRWEKRPRAFLRWSEFLWQEGHTAFANEDEARSEVIKMLDIYKDVYDFMAIPTFTGRKSENEKFAGAVMTTTVEVMAKDGKAIQGATSHYLGTNFAKVFGVNYLGADGSSHLAHQNSWGLSWRSVGALVMVHGDDNGLRLPPNIAPIQIVIVPIYKDEVSRQQVLDFCQTIKNKFGISYRIKIDERDGQTPGFKFNYWEVRGVPVRLEVGLKELAENKVTLFRRDNGIKEVVAVEDLDKSLPSIMSDIHQSLYQQAVDFSKKNINRIESWDEIKEQTGWFEASWSEDPETEKQLKEKYGIVSRVLLREKENEAPKNKKCFISGQEAKHDWLFAKCY